MFSERSAGSPEERSVLGSDWAVSDSTFTGVSGLISAAYVTPCQKGQSNCDSPSRTSPHVRKDKAVNHRLKEDLKQKQLIQTVFPTPHTALILQVQGLCKIVLPVSITLQNLLEKDAVNPPLKKSVAWALRL